MAVDVDTTHGEVSEGPADAEGADLRDATLTNVNDAKAEKAEPGRKSGVRLALELGLIAALALGCLAGWLGFRAYESQQAKEQRELFLQVGRQGALNLTTISYTEAEADVQRVIDSATGTFRSDFQKRSPAFIDVVKRAQSKSEGTITQAGLESADQSHAEVLVAVSVKTTLAGAPEQEPRAWRMRITVQKDGDAAKISNVAFVP
jgi:Mce-associated membrane protein